MLVIQALLTTRKQKKKFAIFDLVICLCWEGEWHLADALPAKVSIVTMY